MFPIRDHNPSGRLPIVTILLIAINILVFLSYFPTNTENGINQFIFDWGLIPARVMAGFGYETILTSMFLHGGWMHLAGNMLFLWIFGDNLEDALGHVGFLLFYLASGIGAAAAQSVLDLQSGIPMVGASGAIAGVLGGYLLLFPKARVDVLFIFIIIFRIFPIPAWIVLGLWLGLQIFSGVSTPSDAGGVAYWAHVGGFVTGLVLTVPVWLRRGAQAFWQKTGGHPPNPEAEYRLGKSSVPRVPRR
ncbi:MAG: rhomboid family intramembrane serine protease [Pseudomonadota bacterium]